MLISKSKRAKAVWRGNLKFLDYDLTMKKAQTARTKTKTIFAQIFIYIYIYISIGQFTGVRDDISLGKVFFSMYFYFFLASSFRKCPAKWSD